jgi:hypothetical protein
MAMKYLLILFSILSVFTIDAQPTFDNVYRNDTFSTFYWQSNLQFMKVIADEDVYYTWGLGLDSSHQVSPSNAWYQTGLFSKIDTNGNVLSHRLYGNFFNRFYSLRFGMEKTNDDNFFIAGTHYDTIQGRYFLMKVDELGDTLWRQFYQPTTPQSGIGFYNVRKTMDGGAALLLYQIDFLNPDVSVATPILLKVDSLGIEQWRKTYYRFDGYSGQLLDILEYNNGYVMLRRNQKGVSGDHWDYKAMTSIEQLDSAGNLITSYSSPLNRYINGIRLIQTQDKGFVICGNEGTQTPSSNPNYPVVHVENYIFKLDSALQFVWEQKMPPLIQYENFRDVEELVDGSLIAVGNNIISYPDNISLQLGVDSADFMGYAVKFASDGTVLWERNYKRWYNTMNGVRQYIRDVEVLDDGRLLMAGYIEDNNSFSPTTGYWGWLIRTDSFGCIVPGCQLLDNTENVGQGHALALQVTVYPNPASEVVKFRFDKAMDEKVEIRMYSGLGQLIGEINVNYSTETQMNVSDWNSGVYFYGVYVEGRLVKQGQVLVQK